MNDQRGNVDAAEVLAEVFIPSGHASETCRGRCTGGDIPAGLDGLLADALAEENVGVEEVFEKFREEGVAIRRDGFLNALEDGGVDAFGVIRGFEKERRDGSNENGVGHAFRSVLTDVTCDFAAAHGKANQGEITQVEMGEKLVQVFGEGIVVVAGSGLAGAAKAAPVVGDDTMAGS